MQILVVKKPSKRFLMCVDSRTRIDEIESLIHSGKREEAIASTLKHGIKVKKVAKRELPFLDVDLIITDVGSLRLIK